MKKLGAIVRNHYKKLLAILTFLLLWQLVVMFFGIKEFILPSPLKTFSYLVIPELAAQYEWPRHIGVTLIDDVQSIIFRFMQDDGEWTDQWPPGPRGGPGGLRLRPRAVQVVLTLIDEGEILRLIEVAP